MRCIPFAGRTVIFTSIPATGIRQNQPLLKKTISILLLLVFVWAQYVKQAVYLECRLAGSFKSYAVTCDCEKKAGLDKPGTENDPLSKAHSHTHPDELFPLTDIIQNDFSLYVHLKITTAYHNEGASSGWGNKPFHPPRCC